MVVNAGDCVYLVTSPGQQQPVIDWLDKYTIMEDLRWKMFRPGRPCWP